MEAVSHAKSKADSAAEELHAKLSHYKGLITVGYTETHLIVYWRGATPNDMPKVFKRFPVAVQQTNRVTSARR